MPSTRSRDVVHNLNVLLCEGSAGGLDDGQLLTRFLVAGDESAFAILVERHGPVVLRVCRSVLGPAEDPRDAFQATFLALVKKAQSLLGHSSLGPWLVGVSYRIATRARIDAFRRSTHERTAAADRPTEHAPGPSPETWAELYQELARLPGKYRDPLVLCYLEGRTAEQAAASLGCPRGTILSRMARAKAQLKERLTRRGVTTTDASLVVALSPSSTAPLPSGLSAATTQAAMRLAGRSGLAWIVALARSTAVAGAILAAAVAAFGFTLVSKPEAQDPPPPPAASLPPPAVEPQVAKEVPKLGESKTLTVEARDLITDQPATGIEIKLNVIRSDQKWLKATSDENGRARFQLSQPEKIEYLQAFLEGGGLVPLGLNWDRNPSSSQLDHVLLQTEHATTIKGRVVDDEQRPVAGATVVIDATKRYPKSPQWVAVGNEKVQTDADGRWSFTGVPDKSDSVKLAVYHHLYLEDARGSYYYHTEEFKPLPALRDGTATLRLKRGTPVNGTVLGADGKPVKSALVHFKDPKPWSNSVPPVATDEQGRFALGFQPGTTVNLTVLSPGFAPERETIRVGADPVSVAIRLQAPHRLQGQLVDAGGKPVTHSRVDIDSWRGFEGFDKGIITDAEGKFAWDDAPADEVRTRISAIGYAAQEAVPLLAGTPNRIVMTRQTTIKGTVVDEATGKPIPSYSLLLGVVWRPNERLIWQRGMDVNRDARRSPAGFEYTVDQAVDRHQVRVEAEGYAPADSGLIASDGTAHEVVYRLKKADPIRGVVLNGDGSPAGEGFVYLVLESDSLRIDNGKVDDRDRPMTVHAKIGSDGRFVLPAQIEPYVLVALCKSGIAVDDRRTGPGADSLRLQPWARLSGVISRDGKPTAKAVLYSELHHAPADAKIPMLNLRAYLTTDEQGRFTLDRLTPGRQVFYRRVPNNTPRRDWFLEAVTLDARPGGSYELNIGASGHPVVGKLTLPPGKPWMIRKSSIEAKGADASVPKHGVEVAEDGRFRADDVPAGDYVMKIALHEPPPENACGWGALVAAFSHEFKVSSDGRETVDLGVLDPVENHERPVEVGQPAPDFNIKTTDGRAVSLGGLKGKYVLLDFWATWCAPCIEEIPNLKAAHERFAADPRFAMVSLSLDEKPEDPSNAAEAMGLAWPQACVGPESDVVAAYGASAIPQTVLIGPDGRVIARDLRGKRIAEAIAEAMKK